MKTKIICGFATLALSIAISATAQTITQFVTIASTNETPFNYQVQTNQIISLVGYDWRDGEDVFGTLFNGTTIVLTPYNATGGGSGSSQAHPSSQIPQTATGLTNVYVLNNSWATFKIETPALATVVSNYVPADAIVIPASATGNVQIILESSPDLVNWTAANPGTYGASAGTNRFFRVRATVGP